MTIEMIEPLAFIQLIGIVAAGVVIGMWFTRWVGLIPDQKE